MIILKALKKGKSAAVDNIPAELVQAGGEPMITALHIICNKIWQTGEWLHTMDTIIVITHPSEERQFTYVP